jgi:hypothetical protein
VKLQQIQLKHRVAVASMPRGRGDRFFAGECNHVMNDSEVASLVYQRGQVVVTTKKGEVFGVERSNLAATWPPLPAPGARTKEQSDG